MCTLLEAGRGPRERFDLEPNTWSDVPSLKMTVTSAAVADDDTLYVTDGDEVVKKFNNKTRNWTEMTVMLIPRSGFPACVLNIYMVGGTENTNKVERYDVTDTIESCDLVGDIPSSHSWLSK